MNNNTTTAADYKKAVAASEPTQNVTLPSGNVFTLRAPNAEAFVLSGMLPVTLADKLENLMQDAQGGDEIANRLSPKELEQTVKFQRALLKQICISPRVVENPDPDANELGFTDLAQSDLRFLISWGISGGGRADADSFRGASRSPAVAGNNRKKLRNAAK